MFPMQDTYFLAYEKTYTYACGQAWVWTCGQHVNGKGDSKAGQTSMYQGISG